MENSKKRPRKANLTDTEVRVLLEEIIFEHQILFMANTQAVTNKVKADAWRKSLIKSVRVV